MCVESQVCSFTLICGLHCMVGDSFVTIAMTLLVQVYFDTFTKDLILHILHF